MEINEDDMSIAHIGTNIVKIFDNPEECVAFCDKMKDKFKIKVSADPLYVVMNQVEIKGEISRGREGY